MKRRNFLRTMFGAPAAAVASKAISAAVPEVSPVETHIVRKIAAGPAEDESLWCSMPLCVHDSRPFTLEAHASWADEDEDEDY